MTADFAHLDALRSSLSHEHARLAAARKPDEIASRKVRVAQIEKEIAGEIASLARRGIVEPVDEAITSAVKSPSCVADEGRAARKVRRRKAAK